MSLPSILKDLTAVNTNGEAVNNVYNILKEVQEKQARNAYIWGGRSKVFTNTKMESVKEIPTYLTNAQLGYLLLLQTYMNYNGVITNLDSTTMKTSDMMKVLKIKKTARKSFYRFLNTCLEHNIITKTNDEYRINEKYHYKGRSRSKEGKTVKIYTTQIRNAYSKLKPEDLGLLYKMIPYIHMKTNTLCFNPYEENPTKIKKLNRNHLAEILGVTPSYISSRLMHMKYDGKYLIAKVRVGGKDSYLVNPWVFYRLTSNPTDDNCMLDHRLTTKGRPDDTLLSIFSEYEDIED